MANSIVPVAKNTKETPLSKARFPDRCGQWCKCEKCKVVARCTPEFDFFTGEDELGPLRCLACSLSARADVKAGHEIISKMLKDGQ